MRFKLVPLILILLLSLGACSSSGGVDSESFKLGLILETNLAINYGGFLTIRQRGLFFLSQLLNTCRVSEIKNTVKKIISNYKTLRYTLITVNIPRKIQAIVRCFQLKGISRQELIQGLQDYPSIPSRKVGQQSLIPSSSKR